MKKTIKVIDLLNKINNGEELPKKIRFTWIDYVEIYEYSEEHNWYYKIDDGTSFSITTNITLNMKVEIIEEDEKPKEINKLTFRGKDIGYGAMGEWLDNPSDNELRVCSAIEEISITTNKIINAVNYLLNKEVENNESN